VDARAAAAVVLAGAGVAEGQEKEGWQSETLKDP
jgi:hypothetical protein